MTNDKRLEQETGSEKRDGAQPAAHDYRAAEQRAEELRAISPVFRRLLRQKPDKPSSDQWRLFSQELSRKLEVQDAPYTQTLRERISNSDSPLLRWFWIVIALLALIAVGAAIGFSVMNQPAPTAIAHFGVHGNEDGIACLSHDSRFAHGETAPQVRLES